MKILILGGTGMLGHRLFQAWKESHTVRVTLRESRERYKDNMPLVSDNNYFNIDVSSVSVLRHVFDDFSPDIVVNAIGITKQLTQTLTVEVTNNINAQFPLRLADLCKQYKCRLILMSSDCVFSGKKGSYTEDDQPDAEDIYGQSKAAGEVLAPHVLTLRKSTIGLELGSSHGLVEWFLKQKGEVKGFSHAIYSGLITSELAAVIEMILIKYPELHGIYNVASEPISKYDLLVNLNNCLRRKDLTIIPDDEIVCDRSLNGTRFEDITKYKAPSWDDMIEKLACEIRKRESE